MEINQIVFNTDKILLHGHRLQEYIDNDCTSSPITVTVDLTNRCNNKCPHCISILKDNEEIDYNTLLALFKDFSDIGVKGVLITGGGEPLLYKRLTSILRYGNLLGLKFGMITSGQDIDRDDEEWIEILSYLSWIRFSLDAGTPERYKQTHGLDEYHFNKVINLINRICKLKNRYKSNCDIGIGYIINLDSPNKEQEDIHQALKLVLKEGLDYFQLRPVLMRGEDSDVRCVDYLQETVQMVNESNINVKLYNTSISRRVDKNFSYCHGSHFITSICANSKVYYCCILKNVDYAEIGDLKKDRFKDIWISNNIRKIGNNINLSRCPNRCKNNVINNLIEKLMEESKSEHKDFL